MKDRNNNDKLYNYLNNKRVRECSFSSLGCKNSLNLFTEEDVFNHNFEHLNEHMSLIVRRMNEMLNEHKEIKKRYHRIEKILSNLQAFKSYSINIKNDNDKNNNKIYQKKMKTIIIIHITILFLIILITISIILIKIRIIIHIIVIIIIIIIVMLKTIIIMKINI